MLKGQAVERTPLTRKLNKPNTVILLSGIVDPYPDHDLEFWLTPKLSYFSLVLYSRAAAFVDAVLTDLIGNIAGGAH